jgi:hypothetical protein
MATLEQSCRALEVLGLRVGLVRCVVSMLYDADLGACERGSDRASWIRAGNIAASSDCPGLWAVCTFPLAFGRQEGSTPLAPCPSMTPSVVHRLLG